MSVLIAKRLFEVADQAWFAAVSGDNNPMHMDALVARRTMAGSPVVHGIHALLWTLDSLVWTMPDLPSIASLKASFEKMIYVGDSISAVLEDNDPRRLKIAVMVEDITAISIELEFGLASPAEPTREDGPLHHPARPSDLTFDEIEKLSGYIPLPEAQASLRDAFSSVTRVLGIERVAGLAGTSFLVGMVCPGLHSIYRNLTLVATETHDSVLRFCVKYSDADYRFVRLAVSGAGWTGLVDTNVRPAPTAQADIILLTGQVGRDEFVGTTALIIGGSRGLGEILAKILAAGGAHVTVTYAVGELDALRLQEEIRAFGGFCDVLRYDVRQSAPEQIARLSVVPNQLFYMATPTIFQRTGGSFSNKRLQNFLIFYVVGFECLCQALRQAHGDNISVFYPSSESIDDRPANMTEYTMAKAAGEILCADMKSFGEWRNILIKRLPRLPTDQTATLFDDESEDPIRIMLPIVREMHGEPRT